MKFTTLSQFWNNYGDTYNQIRAVEYALLTPGDPFEDPKLKLIRSIRDELYGNS